jgi:hypothetical protein
MKNVQHHHHHHHGNNGGFTNMATFWLNFAITEAIGVAQVFVENSKIKPGLKAALENLIAAGQGTLLAIQAGD